jgi:hypothetical protein
MRCGVAESVARVGNTSSDHCRHGIGYPFARSVLYEALTVLATAYPADVILISHILSRQWCAVRARRRVLPIRRSVRTVRWSTPDVGRAAMCVARKGFGYSYIIAIRLSVVRNVPIHCIRHP